MIFLGKGASRWSSSGGRVGGRKEEGKDEGEIEKRPNTSWLIDFELRRRPAIARSLRADEV